MSVFVELKLPDSGLNVTVLEITRFSLIVSRFLPEHLQGMAILVQACRIENEPLTPDQYQVLSETDVEHIKQALIAQLISL